MFIFFQNVCLICLKKISPLSFWIFGIILQLKFEASNPKKYSPSTIHFALDLISSHLAYFFLIHSSSSFLILYDIYVVIIYICFKFGNFFLFRDFSLFSVSQLECEIVLPLMFYKQGFSKSWSFILNSIFS